MKNRDYWRHRAEILEASKYKQAVNYSADAEKRFNLAQKIINEQIEQWYARFAKNNEISLTEARQWLTGKDLAEFKWDVQEYIEHGRDVELNPEYIKQLENASARFHISKLEALKLKTQNTIEILYGQMSMDTSNLLTQIYSENYYHTAYEIQKGVGIGWDIAAINNDVLEKILSKPWGLDNKTFSDRLWTQKQSLINTLHTQLTQNAILGRAPDKAISEIAKKFKTSKTNAGRLVMTESAFYSNEAQKNAYKTLDVEEFEIVSALDGMTCPACGDLDGTHMPMSQYETGVTVPPFHPWCRCCTAPYFSDNEGERYARDVKTGKGYHVPAGMTYKEWKEKYVKSDPEKYAIFKGKQNESSDIKQYEKYKAVYGEKFPKTIEEFWVMKYNDSERWESFKAGKQETLNQLKYSKKLNGKFSDYEVRVWYDAHDRAIKSIINTSLPLKEQAIQAHGLRNLYKEQARNMMADTKKADNLRKKYPPEPFEFYHKKYLLNVSNDEEVYKLIIDSATRSNKKVNLKLGVESE